MLWLIQYILILAIGIPISIILSLVMLQFWRWFEAVSGIESVGHSGPAIWCYLVLYIVWFVGVIFLMIRNQNYQDGNND